MIAAVAINDQEVLLILDSSDLRKPNATRMGYLDTVLNLDGSLVNGFQTLNA